MEITGVERSAHASTAPVATIPTERAAEGIKITLTPIASKGGVARSPLKSTTTFSTGEFEFSTVPPGRYILEVA